MEAETELRKHILITLPSRLRNAGEWLLLRLVILSPFCSMHFSSGKRWVIFTTWLKYLSASALFVLMTGFVGEHSIRQRIQRKREIATLRQTIAQLQERFAQDKAKLDLLKSDTEELRRVARERYYMRTEGEDVFIIMDEQ